MAQLHKILRTSVYIIEDDQNFIRSLKQLFARGIENYKIFTFANAGDLYAYLTANKLVRVQRNVLILPFSSRLGDKTSILECVEMLRQILVNAHVILTYNPGEIEKDDLNKYRVEQLVEDVIVKNNFARLHIQNVIRRIVSHDDFVLRRKLLFLSGLVSVFLLLTTVLFYFL